MAIAAVAGVAVVFTAVLFSSAAGAAPRSIQKVRAADGLSVRLLAVQRAKPYEYSYTPPVGAGRQILKWLGRDPAEPPIRRTMKLTDGALLLWLWVGRPVVELPLVAVSDELGHRYISSALTQPLRAEVTRWGRGSLAAVALTDFDRTARQLTFELQFGQPEATVTLRVDGPGEPPATWAAGSTYPLAVGSGKTTVLLHQLRPLDPLSMTDLISLARPPEPVDRLLMADFGVRDEPGGPPGQWVVEVVQAVTDHGERLNPLRHWAGLVFLTTGRRPTDFHAARLEVVARKEIRGSAPIVFRRLAVPHKTGEMQSWNQSATPPFPGAQFVCLQGARTAANRLSVSLEGRGPRDAEVALSLEAGLDDTGAAVVAADEVGVGLLEREDSPAGSRRRWLVELAVRPEAKAVALAFRASYRATVATVTGTLTGQVQPARDPRGEAGLGLVLAPPATPGKPWRVEAPLAGSRAVAAGLVAGDEVLAIDGLPVEMLPRALLRHTPDETVTVVYRRAGKTGQVQVALDPLGPVSPPPSR